MESIGVKRVGSCPEVVFQFVFQCSLAAVAHLEVGDVELLEDGKICVRIRYQKDEPELRRLLLTYPPKHA